MIRIWHPVIIHKDAVVHPARFRLQWQGDEIAETSFRQGVLIRDYSVVRIQAYLGVFFDNKRHHIRQHLAYGLRRNTCLQKEPEVGTLAGSRFLQRNSQAQFPCLANSKDRIASPRRLVKVDDGHTYRLVRFHWVNPHHKVLHVGIFAAQVPSNHLIGDWHILPHRTLAAFLVLL